MRINVVAIRDTYKKTNDMTVHIKGFVHRWGFSEFLVYCWACGIVTADACELHRIRKMINSWTIYLGLRTCRYVNIVIGRLNEILILVWLVQVYDMGLIQCTNYTRFEWDRYVHQRLRWEVVGHLLYHNMRWWICIRTAITSHTSVLFECFKQIFIRNRYV